MVRTESISFQVHPDDEQSQINIMEKFHWNLLNTQDVKTVDSHQEQRGDKIYSVTKTEHYIKLSFTRPVDFPNNKDIKSLEQQYNDLPRPIYPPLFPYTVIPWIIGTFVYGIGLVAWVAYFVLFYLPKKKAADALFEQNKIKQNEIMKQLEKFD